MEILSMLVLLFVLLAVGFLIGFLVIYIPYKRGGKAIKQHGFTDPIDFDLHSSVDSIEENVGSSLDGFKAVDNFNKE